MPRRRLYALALVAFLAALPAWQFLGRANDDIFITYRYADNLARGFGLAFNPGERVFGVSDPGVAALLGLGSFLSRVPTHLLGTLLMLGSLVAIAAVVLRCGEAGGRLPEAFVASTLLAISPYAWACQAAGPVVAAAAVLSSAALLPGRPVPAGILSGLAIWARPDTGIAVVLLSLLLWFSRPGDRRRLLPFATTVGATTVVGALGVYMAFGTLLPNAVAAKRDFAALGSHFFTGTEFWRRGIDLFANAVGQSVWFFVVPGIAGIAWLLRQPQMPLRLAALYGLVSATFYTALDLPFFAWYLFPALLALLCGWCFALGAAMRACWNSRGRAATAVVALFAASCVGRAAWAGARFAADAGAGNWRTWAYRSAGEWIRANAAADDEITFDEVGILAYFSDRPVRDLIGLVSPENRPFAAVGDPLGAFLRHPTALVPYHTFTPRGGTGPIVRRPWFADAYREAVRLENPALGGAVIIYRRVDAAAIPAPRPPHPRGAS